MGNRKGSILFIILSLLFLIAVSTGNFFYWQTKQNFPSDPLIPITPSPNPVVDHQQGKSVMNGGVIVVFNDGTTFKQAKDYLDGLGYKINEDTYWGSEKTKPIGSTPLKNSDLIVIDVPKEKINEAISLISKSPIVNYAEENSLITIPDCYREPC